MTRLVRRYQGGGAGWIGVAQGAMNLVQTGVKSYFDKRKAEEEKKKAILEAQAAESKAESDRLRAQMAQVAGQYDKGGNSSTMDVVNSSLRVRPELTYHSDTPAPGYQPASVPQTNPSVVNSGMLSGVVSSFFNKDKEEEPYAGTNIHDMSPDQQRQVKAGWRQQLAGTLEGTVEAQGEEKPAVTGEVPQSDPKEKPVGAGGNMATDTEAGKKVAKEKVKTAVTAAPAGKNGCKLKKRFNPRQFKKQK